MSKYSENKQNVIGIILAGERDFGRYPLASRLSTALWPIFDRPAIEHLLFRLSEYGVKQTIICSNSDDTAMRKAIEGNSYPNMELKFSESSLPAGTAGSIRQAVNGEKNSLLLVFPASMVNVPDIETLIEAHYRGQCELTVVLNPADENSRPNGESAGIYVCEPTILEHIPVEGYYDIKESLIPAMLRVGKNIYAARLSMPVGGFRNFSEYINAMVYYLESSRGNIFNFPVSRQDELRTLWKGTDSHIDSSARVYGPVVIM
ncbi:MAG: NDP-sugar synthase, partial [Sedimentisphaerales bacterium]